MAGKEMVPAAMGRPEWLPEGWSVEYRKRTLSNTVDKYYICPLSGKKLRSRPEVMRFLNNEIPERPASAPVRGGYKPLVRLDYHPSELPDGWIVEIRPRKNSGRVDSYYIDPISGCKFRSKKEVFRYLANQEVSRVAYKQKRMHATAVQKRIHTPDAYISKEESLPLITFIKSRVKRTVTRRRLFPREDSVSNASTEIKIVDPPEKQALLLPADSSVPLVVDPQPSSPAPAIVKHLEKMMNNFPIDCQDKSASHENNFPIECQDKSASHENNLKGKSEIKTLPEPGNEKLLDSSMQLEGQKKSVPDANIAEEKQLDLPNKQSQTNSQTTNEAVRPVIDRPSPRKRKAEIENPIPSQDSKQLACLTVNCESEETSRREKTRKIDQDVSITDELREKLEHLKPFVERVSQEKQEEQKDASETEELREKLAELDLLAEQDSKKQAIEPIPIPPSGDSWADPCIEFAFKTLTSDVLALEGINTLQDYLDKQPVSSRSSNGVL